MPKIVEIQQQDDFALEAAIREHIMKVMEENGEIRRLKEKVKKVLEEDKKVKTQDDKDSQTVQASFEDVADKNGVVDRAV